MKLVSLQKPSHWKEAQVKGVLTGGTTLHHVEPEWRHAYTWMRDQMKARLPWTSGDFPVWAWSEEYFLSNVENLRGAAEELGTTMVELHFEVPDSRVLQSNFVAWHVVLGKQTFKDGLEPHESWPLLFTPEAIPDYTGSASQYCVDRVFPSEVTLTHIFTVT